MPTLNKPAGRVRIPLPIGSQAPASTPSAFGKEVVADLADTASGGANTVDDYLHDLLARSGHDTSAATEYSAGVGYAVGDEVYWRDGSNKLRFFLRLTAGTDAAGSNPLALSSVWRQIVNDLSSIPVDGDGNASKALVVREAGHGSVRAEVAAWTKLAASQSSAQVSALITAAISGLQSRADVDARINALVDSVAKDGSTARWPDAKISTAVARTTAVTAAIATAVHGILDDVVDNSRWTGPWMYARNYRIGDYATDPHASDTSIMFRRKANPGSDANGEHPSVNSTDWEVPTGTPLLEGERLRDISELLNERLGISPTDGDSRGMWIRQSPAGRTYEYQRPPVHFHGAYNGNATYHFGAMVTLGDALWIVTNPARIVGTGITGHQPSDSSTEWTHVAVTSAHVEAAVADWATPGNTDKIPTDKIPTAALSEWHDGAVVARGGDNVARLESPGAEAIWGGPSLVERGTPETQTEHFSPRFAGGSAHDQYHLHPEPTPAELSQFLASDGFEGLQFGDAVPNGDLSMKLAVTWVSSSGNAEQVRVELIHYSSHWGSPRHLLDVRPTIEATAHPSTPFVQEFAIPLAGVTFLPHDRLAVRYTASAPSNSNWPTRSAGWFTGISLEVTLPGVHIEPSNFDSYPVEARPIRDLISHDLSEATARIYQAPDWVRALAQTNGYTPFKAVSQGGTGGDNWRLENPHARGYNGLDRSIDVVATSAGVDLGMRLEFDVRFEDRTKHSDRPDQLLCVIIVPTGNDINRSDAALASYVAYDIVENSGDIPITVPTETAHPIARWGTLPGNVQKISRVTNNQYLRYDRDGSYRIRLEATINLTADPGDMTFKWHWREHDSNGDHNIVNSVRLRDLYSGTPTSGAPRTAVQRFYDTRNQSGRALTADDFWLELVPHTSSSHIDYSAISSMTVNVKVSRDDDDHGHVTLEVPNRTFNDGDRVTFAVWHETDYAGDDRRVWVTKQKLSIWNVGDVEGRTETFTSNAVANLREFRFPAGSEDSPWWGEDDGVITAARGMRRAHLTAKVPHGSLPRGTRLRITREVPGLATRETVVSHGFTGHESGTVQFDGVCLAVVPGERFRLIADSAGTTVAGAILEVEAQTPVGYPARQVRTAGLLRTQRVIDTVRLGTSGTHPFWRRLPGLNGWTWAQAGTLVIAYDAFDETDDTKPHRWQVLPGLPTSLIQELPALPTSRVDTSFQDSDATILANIGGAGRPDIHIAPLADGDIAVSAQITSGREVRGWVV